MSDDKKIIFSMNKVGKQTPEGKQIIKNGEVIGYKICNPELQDDCDKNFDLLNAHDLCRLSNSVDSLNDKTLDPNTRIYDIIPDCYSSLCSNSRSVPFIYDPTRVEPDNAEESKMLKSVKDDIDFEVVFCQIVNLKRNNV